MDPHAAHGTEHGHAHHELGFIRKYIFSEDHKIIGIQFLFTSIHLPRPGRSPRAPGPHPARLAARRDSILHSFFADNGGRVSESFYNMLFTMHASVMIFFVIIPFLTAPSATSQSR